ncbi:FAGR165Wp [Eremothecium gossypii FDAG1]|nr:FAGR165Wp [Eremothecium gossypii FDAG1]
MELNDRLIISKPLYISEAADPQCGYCKGRKDSKNNYACESWHERYAAGGGAALRTATIGLQAELLPVQVYDELCNMGFRRSGDFVYKTDPLRNCCRMYTIRTSMAQLHASKELRSCVKRFLRHIGAGAGGHGVEALVAAEQASTRFCTRFEPARFTQEKYELFVRYQRAVHHDTGTIEPLQFNKFLCESPFPEDVVLGTAEEWAELNGWRSARPGQRFRRVGPVHECYYFDGKLIALGVSDFLPSGVSSVYFIWDPDYSKWSLGKLSALREMAIVERIGRSYYYLGYYIEDCPKMKYKAKYGGELLDVCNNQYLPLRVLEPFIEHGRFFVLDRAEPDADCSDDEAGDDPLSELPLDDRARLDPAAPLRDVVERIYGASGGAFAAANQAVEGLVDLGVEYTPQLDDGLFPSETPDLRDCLADVYQLPNVVPGLVPLWQILKILKSGEIRHINTKLMIYDTRLGRVRLVRDFHQEAKTTKRVICNVIRLIGLKNTANSLIVI